MDSSFLASIYVTEFMATEVFSNLEHNIYMKPKKKKKWFNWEPDKHTEKT
jgi:hypothetical protein